jgi:hypothetical protein
MAPERLSLDRFTLITGEAPFPRNGSILGGEFNSREALLMTIERLANALMTE